MKHPFPGLFEQAPAEPTTSPRFNTPAMLAVLYVQVWQHTPATERGIIRSKECIWDGAGWPSIDSLTGEQLLNRLPAAIREQYTR